MARLQRPAQWRARAKQMRLTNILIEGLGTQAVGQGPISAVALRHLALRPITSTPGGGTNENRSGANFALRLELVKVNWVT